MAKRIIREDMFLKFFFVDEVLPRFRGLPLQNATTFSMTTLIITTFRIVGLNATLSIRDTQHNFMLYAALFTVMLIVIC
jgi:hypothetical protein